MLRHLRRWMKMKTLKLGLYTLAVLTAHAGFAAAAWNNVFQATLYSKSNPPAPTTGPGPRIVVAQPVSSVVVGKLTCDSCGGRSYGYSTYDAGCCPQQTCTTRYIQRTYYQPVTTYTTKTYYEPVTTYQTSY